MRYEIMMGSSIWRKLEKLHQIEGVVRIGTYNVSRRFISWLAKQLMRRPRDIYLLLDEKFVREGASLKRQFPHIRVAISDTHLKILMIEPDGFYQGGVNAGLSNKFDGGSFINDRRGYERWLREFDAHWSSEAQEIIDPDVFLANYKAPPLRREYPPPLSMEELDQRRDEHRAGSAQVRVERRRPPATLPTPASVDDYQRIDLPSRRRSSASITPVESIDPEQWRRDTSSIGEVRQKREPFRGRLRK